MRTDLENEVKQIFDLYRGMILDSAEEAIDPKQWEYSRRRLLKLLSQDRGLEAKVLKIIREV